MRLVESTPLLIIADLLKLYDLICGTELTAIVSGVALIDGKFDANPFALSVIPVFVKS